MVLFMDLQPIHMSHDPSFLGVKGVVTTNNTLPLANLYHVILKKLIHMASHL